VHLLSLRSGALRNLVDFSPARAATLRGVTRMVNRSNALTTVDPVHAHSEQIKGCSVLDTCPKPNNLKKDTCTLDTCPNITDRKAVFSDEGWNPPLSNIGAAAVDLKRLQRALELVSEKQQQHGR
jgi:hypothetical protein